MSRRRRNLQETIPLRTTQSRSIVVHTAVIPSPHKPTITAFTPYRDGKFGVTIAEYAVEQVSVSFRQ